MKLWKKLAALCGFFYCPMCGKYSRTKLRYFIGGRRICSRCESEIISRNIKGWYGDFK